ncbi:MAG: hypothetical protein GXO44_03460 [Deferribacteres bacterium]|nr:hypothetical protein [Deferribacteres bacterium]
MKSYLVEGRYISAENFTPSHLPVKYYGKIDWKQKVKNYTPRKEFKLFRRIPDSLKNLIKLLDSFTHLDKILSLSQNIGIIAAGKLEMERDEIALKAHENPRQITPSDGFIFTHNGINFLVANYLGIRFYKGLGIDHVCSSGNDIMGIADKLIKDGIIDTALLIAINSMACPSRTGYHKTLGVVSKSGKIMPFDEKRDGTVFADALAVAVITGEKILEKLDTRFCLSIEGYEVICDSYHMFSLDEKGTSFFTLTEALLNKTGAPKESVELVKAHATGTKLNDAAESRAYNKIFGDNIQVTALKPVIGHTVTASGLIESIILMESLKEGILPQTANHEKLGSDCAKIKVLTTEVPYRGGLILSVSAGFGGFFSAILLKGAENGG